MRASVFIMRTSKGQAAALSLVLLSDDGKMEHDRLIRPLLPKIICLHQSGCCYARDILGAEGWREVWFLVLQLY